MYKLNKIFLLFWICVGALEAQPVWEVIGEIDRPITGAQAIVLNSKIYVIGGRSATEQRAINWIQEYDPVTNSWKQVATMQANRNGFFVASSVASIFFIGGIEEDSPLLFSLEDWSPINPDTTLILGFDDSFDRIYPTGNYRDNRLYLFGGFPFTDIDDTVNLPYFAEIDLSTGSIINSENFSFDFNNFPDQQMSAIFDNSIYIFGGTFNGVLKSIFEYKIDSNELIEFNIELRDPRAGGVAVKSDSVNEVYIIGGFTESNTALSSVEIFNPFVDTGITQVGPELNRARRNLTAVFHENAIYVFGGTDESGSYVTEIEKLDFNITTAVENDGTLPNNFRLNQNFPNPFNPSTVISYNLPSSSFVNLKLFDILGKEIKELINEIKDSGYYEISIEAKGLTSGIYFYRLNAYPTDRTVNFSETKKMVVIK